MKITNETTYGEIIAMFPTTGDSRVPGIKQLQKKAKSLHRQETGSGFIEIYDNGFYTYTEDDRTTVYGVDRCARMEWIQRPEGADDQEACDLGPLPYELVLEMAGSYRLEHNTDSREQSKEDLSLDVPGAENSLAFSVLPEHEIREREEDETAHKENMLSELYRGLGALKPKQEEILTLRFGKNMTYEEIAEYLGISKGTAFTNCERALKRAQKKISTTF